MIKSLILLVLSLPTLAYLPQEIEALQNPTLQNENLKGKLYGITSRKHWALGLKNAKKAVYQRIYLVQKPSGEYVLDHYCRNWESMSSRGMNLEHTWPKSRFNDHISQNMQESDLHHLYPVNSTANSKRGNDPFAEVDGTDIFKGCNASQMGKALAIPGYTQYLPYSFQPPQEHRGNVARAMFYFAVRYQLSIDPIEEYYLRKWHLDDPVDVEELVRNDLIEEEQGNRNPFVDYPELTERIENF